jgi:tetratricopeptide (TPR) repeat protein
LDLDYFFIPVFVFLFLYIRFSGYGEFGEMHFLNNVLASEASWSTIWATKFDILGKYLLLLIFPHPLLYDYSFNQIPLTALTNPLVLFSFSTYLFALVYLSVIIFRKIKMKKVSTDQSLIAFAIAWFFLGLFVSSNLVILIGSTMGERFLYIPSLGFILIVVVGLFRVVRRQRFFKVSAGTGMALFYSLVLVLLTGYSVKTILRNQAWKDEYTLCSSDMQYLGNNVKANVFLAYLYRQKGDQATDSIVRAGYYLQAIEYNEKALSIYGELAEVQQVQGFLYGATGDFRKASDCYQRAIRLNPAKVTNYIQAGKAFGRMKLYGQGIEFLLTGVKLDSCNTDLLSLLGIFYAETGDVKQAVSWFNKLMVKDPSNRQAKAYINWVNKQKKVTKHAI